MRSAKAHRHTESLSTADGNVKPHFTHGFEHDGGHEISDTDHQSIGFVAFVCESFPVRDITVSVGVLHLRNEKKEEVKVRKSISLCVASVVREG